MAGITPSSSSRDAGLGGERVVQAPRVAEMVARLRAAGCVYAEDEAALIVEAAAGDEIEGFRMLEARVAGTPLEIVLGWAAFAGLRIAVDAGVFVPRLRTTLLAEVASRHLRALAPTQTPDRDAGPARALDLGCGSGAVAAALSAWHPTAEVFAADIDPRAVACARRNVGDASRVFESDLFDGLPPALRGAFDVVAANAPYVPTAEIANLPREAREHEPLVALDGGADGTRLHRRIAATAAAWLRLGGMLAIETGRSQVSLTREAMSKAGFETRVETSDDYEATVVVGYRKDEQPSPG